MYFTDQGSVIRKVNTSGVITTIAGNGNEGYNGDGIPATAAEFYGPIGLVFDNAGNLYVGDEGNSRVRKISTSGIITTIAGNGTKGDSGDGGPATEAQLREPCMLTINPSNELYIPDFATQSVRKVDIYGIITTVAGNGISGFSGDGGQATDARLEAPEAVVFDASGNFYISNGFSCTIRKVNTSGIITTVVGNNTCGYSGDGTPATDAQINIEAFCTAIDASGNLYIADYENNRIRKVSFTPTDINEINKTTQRTNIYPNPTCDLLNINNLKTPATYTLQSIVGATVQQGALKEGNNSINIQAVPSGMYLLEITDNEGQRTITKIVKQ